MWCLGIWGHAVGAPFICNGSLIITCACVGCCICVSHVIVSFGNIFGNSCDLHVNTSHALTDAFFRAGHSPGRHDSLYHLFPIIKVNGGRGVSTSYGAHDFCQGGCLEAPPYPLNVCTTVSQQLTNTVCERLKLKPLINSSYQPRL